MMYFAASGLLYHNLTVLSDWFVQMIRTVAETARWGYRTADVNPSKPHQIIPVGVTEPPKWIQTNRTKLVKIPPWTSLENQCG